MTLKDYQSITTGLTQEDIAFRDGLSDLFGEPIDFYDYKTSAKNRLNHALIGTDIDLSHPVNVVGLVDFDANRLWVDYLGTEVEYNLDDLDPRYVAALNQLPNKKIDRLPLTDISVAMLNDLYDDVEMKPQVEELGLTDSRAILERAFANEMVLQVAMEDYIDKNNLGSIYKANEKELKQFISDSSFEASFSKGLDDLDKKMTEMETAKESKHQLEL